MADEMAVVSAGRVLQAGTPHEIYSEPTGREVAALVGEANFLPGHVSAGVATTPVGRIPAPGEPDGDVEVMLRPESMRLELDTQGPARIFDAHFYGHDQLVRARLEDGTELGVRLLGPHPDLVVGSPVRVVVTAPALFFRSSSHEHPATALS